MCSSAQVSLSEAKLLLSSVSIATTNTGCSLPIFVQVGCARVHGVIAHE